MSEENLTLFDPKFTVWIEGHQKPTVRHPDLSTAIAEAERLCKKEGCTVHVMGDLGRVEPEITPVKWTPSTIGTK